MLLGVADPPPPTPSQQGRELKISLPAEPCMLQPGSRRPRKALQCRSPRPALSICSDYMSKSSLQDGCGCTQDLCRGAASKTGDMSFEISVGGAEHEISQVPLKRPRQGSHACTSCCDSGAAGKQNKLKSALHMLVHPGCTDSSHGFEGDDLTCDSQDTTGTNLNLSAAMLHLITDIVRGIIILVSAVVIQAGVAYDADKVDAVCAILVAIFIFVGAIAIFQRLAKSVRSGCCPSSYMGFR